MLKYEIDSYGNVGTIGKYLGKSVSKNVLQFHVITGYDATSFFQIAGKMNPLKVVFKNQTV